MNADRSEQHDALLEAWLDGRLTRDEAIRFHQLLDSDASLREAVELQSRLDASLRRLFDPVAAAHAGTNGKLPHTVAVERSDNAARPAPSPAVPRPRFRRALPLAAAAALLLAACLAWFTWPRDDSPRFIQNELMLTQHSAEEFYRKLEERGFDTDWDCDDDRDFAAYVHRRLKHGLMLATPPAGVEVLGLTYGWTLSTHTVHLSAKVDGRGVVVFADRPGSAAPALSPASGLKAFERSTEHFVLYEITPLEQPRLLGLFREVEVPPEWLRRSYGGIDGGRIRKPDTCMPGSKP